MLEDVEGVVAQSGLVRLTANEVGAKCPSQVRILSAPLNANLPAAGKVGVLFCLRQATPPTPAISRGLQESIPFAASPVQ